MARGFRIGHPREVRLWSEQGSFAVSGQAASLLKASKVAADQGSYSVSGQAASLSYSGVTTYTADLPTNTLTASATTVATYGQAFKQGALGATQKLSGQQINPLSYWPDTSVKFALVSRQVSAGTLSDTLSIGTEVSGSTLTLSDLVTVFTSAEFGTGGTFGTASFSSSDLQAPLEIWATGPIMSSWVYRKQIGSDAHLVAWMEVRLYRPSSGPLQVEVLPWVENGYLLVSGPINKSANYSFSMNGTTKFGPTAIDLPAQCRTPLIGPTVTSYWLGTANVVTIRHDGDYVQATGLVPAYFAKPADGSAQIAALVTSFTPLQQGDYDSMSTGYSSHIGIIPEFDVLYLTNGSAATYKAMIWNAYGAGRYGTHWREESASFNSGADQYRPARLSNHQTLTLERYTGGFETNPQPTGTAPAYYAGTHHPLAGYVAYLCTGWRYHLDTVQFTTSYLQLSTSYADRSNGQCLWKSQNNGSVRYVAWCWRTLAAALAVCPASQSSLASEYRTLLENNINWYYSRYRAQSHNVFGWVEPAEPAGSYPPSDAWYGATWMQDFLTAVWGFTLDLGLGLGATAQGYMEDLFEWKAQSIVGRLGPATATSWLYRDWAPYVIALSPSTTCDWTTGTGPWYSTWKEAYDETHSGTEPNTGLNNAPYAVPGPFTEGALRSSLYPQDSTTISSIAAIAYAVKHGVGGAELARHRLMSASNWPTLGNAMDPQPLWALAPAAFPKWWRGLDVNEWAQITGTAMVTSAANVRRVFDTSGSASGGGDNYSQRLDGYGGATLDQRRSTVWVLAAGGHGDYYGNEVLCLDLSDDAPAWAFRHHGSSGNIVDSTLGGNPSSARYSDGLPASRHTYGQQVFVARHGRALTCGGSLSHWGTVTSNVEAWDVETVLNGSGWAADGAYPAATGALSALAAATTCADPRTDVVYTFSGTRLHTLTPSVGGPTGSAGSGATYSYATLTWNSAYQYQEGAAAMDTSRGSILWTHGYSDGTKAYSVDPSTGTATALAYSGTAATALNAVPASCGMVYVPAIDRFLLRPPDAGGTVYSINPSTFAAESLSTAGGGSIPRQASSGATGGQVTPTGVYNKWQYVPALRGVVYLPGAAYNSWFLRTH